MPGIQLSNSRYGRGLDSEFLGNQAIFSPGDPLESQAKQIFLGRICLSGGLISGLKGIRRSPVFTRDWPARLRVLLGFLTFGRRKLSPTFYGFVAQLSADQGAYRPR